MSRKALIELDGRPAADVYSAELGIPRDKIVDNVLVNPMGRAVGDQVFISSMNGMDANGTLTNYKRINKNDCIYFLSPVTTKQRNSRHANRSSRTHPIFPWFYPLTVSTGTCSTKKRDIFLHMQKTWQFSDHTLALSAVANSIITSM